MQGHIGSGAGVGPSVTEALDSYLEEHVEHKVVDKNRQSYGAEHLKLHLASEGIADIDILKCRMYLRTRRQEGAADSTIRRELTILRAAANHALKWKRLRLDQMPTMELPEEGESEKVEWFTKDQIQAMFKECHTGRLACFLRITYFTASRKGAIQTMLKKQVDRVGGTIALAKPGEKITKKRRPTVPLYPEIRPAIDWLFDHSRTDFLFGAPQDFYKPFSKLCGTLGFEGNPHMLRHSRATHMLHDGEPIYKVAKLLGDTVATVERVYGHSSVEFLQTHSTVRDHALEASLL